ncbi:MAG TPA: hypothetical protein VH208_04955 [Myxococcaceae bacterium]|jgi:hypothetical protein|nr:hypothetical protein [Myxococcaceae bacterium]
MHVDIHFILALIAAICGVLMLLGKRFAKWPLASIAIICLAVNELGILH